MINDFDFVRAQDVPEAIEALAAEGRVIPVAGGTNVLVNMKRAPLEADLLVDLTQIESLQSITEHNGVTSLGAGVTFARLLDWRPGGAVQGLMHPMCVAFAGPLIRNLATLGGNICDASPAADSSPVFLALDANVELSSEAGGSRKMPLDDFFIGVRKTARRADELLTSISFPKPDEHVRGFYYKLGKRKADAISIVSIAITLSLKSRKVEQVRIALGAVAPVAMRAKQAEAELMGAPLSEQAIIAAASTAMLEVSPIDDFRASAAYRRQMVGVLVRRGLQQLMLEHKAD